MRDSKIQAVIALVAEILKVPTNDLGPESSMTNTPLWDSIEHLDICLAFEKRFGTSLDVSAISTATSIRALAAIVPDAAGVAPSSLYPALAQRVTSVEVLRILLSIGPTETMPDLERQRLAASSW
jgi:acyl carrier protein